MKVKERTPRPELLRADADLARLVRTKVALLVCVAECLAVWKEKDWRRPMGCPDFKAFVREYLHMSASWGEEHARLGRRLRTLPGLKLALLRQEVPLSSAIKLARVMEEEDEPFWLEASRGKSFRAIDDLCIVEPVAGEEIDGEDADDLDEVVTMTRASSPVQLAWLRAALMRLDGVAGFELGRDDRNMAVLAEVESTLLGVAPTVEQVDAQRQWALAEARRVAVVANREAERRAELMLPRREVIEPIAIPVPHDLRSRRALARKSKAMPEIAKAIRSGWIGLCQASMIAKAALPSTAAAWVKRARERTHKHLREEVEAADAVGTRRPPTKGELESVVGLERAVAGLTEPVPSRTRQMSAAMYRQRCLLEWRMRRSDREKWYELERMYQAWGAPYGTFLDFVPIAILTSQQLDPERAQSPFFAIGQRDGGCTNPVCTNRDCSAHHIRFRSKGGTDDGWNLTGLDPVCHSSSCTPNGA